MIRTSRLVAVVAFCLCVLTMTVTTWLSPAAAQVNISPAPSQVKKNVVAAIPRHWPPQYSTDEKGHPTGFAIDVMEAISARAGLNVTYKIVNSFAKAVSALKNGDADLIPNSGILPERMDTYGFTAPVETFLVSIFIRDDTHDLTSEADLIGRKLAVVETNIGLLLFGNRKDIDVKVYPDVRTALFELMAGHVDALVYPKSVLMALAREIGIDDRLKAVGKPLKEIKRGIRVMKDNVALLAVLDKAVESYVGTPAYQKVYAKWYGKPKPFWSTPKVLLVLAGFIIITIVIAVGGHYFSILRLNREIKESEERFRTVVEATSSIVWTTGPDGGFIEPQASWYDYTGQPWPDHQGYGWVKMIHPEDTDRIKRLWLQSLENKTNHLSEGRVWNASEKAYRYFTVRAVPLLNKNGSVRKWVGAIADTHERKVAEEATKASEARLKGILDIAPEAVIATDEDLIIRLFNQGAERIFGYEAEEVLARPLDFLIPKRYRDSHRTRVNSFSASQDTYRFMEERQEIYGLRKNGREFPATASVSKLKLSGETIFTVLLHDISDRKQAEAAIVASKEEAEIANYTKTQFLANMSHELRTPLNSIIGFSQILMGHGLGQLDFAKSSEYANNINDSANHLLALLQDILDVSRIEARELDLEKEPVDFDKLIKECFMMMKERANRGGVTLSYTIAEDAPSIDADELRLKQVLLNLLSNAIKFTPKCGETAVRVEANGNGGVFLRVDDTGIGIRKNDISKVLRPFGQVKDIFTRNHEGTGLGLSLAKSLTELHGGTLVIASEVGKGTTVVVELPNGHG
ncbi:MAG: transporter substrate-binding domain-containing protein [Proteobacteria bacterium]|nr:transporter substrate-binding domain-containing protein [Pseudomonadota bacterium]